MSLQIYKCQVDDDFVVILSQKLHYPYTHNRLNFYLLRFSGDFSNLTIGVYAPKSTLLNKQRLV